MPERGVEQEPVQVPVSVHDDERGRLLAVDHAHVPFPVRRSFVVTSPEKGVRRGGHTAHCRQLLTLVTGQVALRLSDDGVVHRELVLSTPGSSAVVEGWEYVDYELLEAGTTLLVLAEEPYDEVARGSA